MDALELQDLSRSGVLPELISTFVPDGITEEFLVVDEMVVVPVLPANKFAVKGGVFDVVIAMDDRELGVLSLMSRLKVESGISGLTQAQRISYLKLASRLDFDNNDLPRFESDCLVIKRDEFLNYFKNRESAPLWGGFIDPACAPSIAKGQVPSDKVKIDIFPGLRIRTDRHRECIALAAAANRAPERFLYLYHYLELDYDYEVIKAVKGLDENNPKGLWDVLKFQSNELERLNFLLKDYANFSWIEKFLLNLRKYGDQSVRIFYTHGKDSNPLSDEEAFRRQLLECYPINMETLREKKNEFSLRDNFTSSVGDYNKKLLKLIGYWIYRVRCCIAHNKIGEYHLNQSDDIDFLVEFAEPLLVEMLRYRMSIL
jgi:hypothetical protein